MGREGKAHGLDTSSNTKPFPTHLLPTSYSLPLTRRCKIIRNLFYFVAVTIVLY